MHSPLVFQLGIIYYDTIQKTESDTISKAIGLNCERLDEHCSERILLKISSLIPNWLEYSDPLGLTPQEVNAIKTDLDLTYMMQTYTLLKTWYRKNAYTEQCSYRVLVTVSCDLGHRDVAGKICQLLKGTCMYM